MSIATLLVRFAALYLLISVGVSIVVNMIGVGGMGLSWICMFVAMRLSLKSYTEANGFFPEGNELFIATFGMLGVVMFFQLGLLVLVLQPLLKKFTPLIWTIVIVFAFVTNWIGVYASRWIIRRELIRSGAIAS